MPVLVIQHPVADFGVWRKAFDSDPLGRSKNGVRRHAIYRSSDDPCHVIITLRFDTRETAQRFLAALEGLWKRVGDPLGLQGPGGVRARIFDEVEQVDY